MGQLDWRRDHVGIPLFASFEAKKLYVATDQVRKKNEKLILMSLMYSSLYSRNLLLLLLLVGRSALLGGALSVSLSNRVCVRVVMSFPAVLPLPLDLDLSFLSLSPSLVVSFPLNYRVSWQLSMRAPAASSGAATFRRLRRVQ